MTTLDTSNYIAPTHIVTNDDKLNILQLTDLHLYLDTSKTSAGINNHHSFMACLDQALSEDRRCDLILVTGDIVNEVKPEIYDRLYHTLAKTGIAFACISGNHDVTDELGSDVSFADRQLVAHQPDTRLLSRHCLTLNNWKLLLLDSSVPGKIYGRVGDKNLQWLNKTLADCHDPVIIAMHHHVLPMNSAWIDNHIAKDAEQFWRVVSASSNVKAVLSGHVHQHCDNERGAIKFYTAPSTCYQFKPGEDDFMIDNKRAPGYRWLTLSKQGEIETWVTRLTTTNGEPAIQQP